MTTQDTQKLREGQLDHQTDKFKKHLAKLQAERSHVNTSVSEANYVKNINDIDPLLSVKKDKEIETYLVMHDSTGAKQGGKFGEYLSHTLDNRHSGDEQDQEGKPSGLQRDEQGKIVPTVEDKKHHIGMVTVVELDRLNTEGGHDAGNVAMASTVRLIEEQIQAALLADPQIGEALKDQPVEDIYDIFHTRGADFAYTLNLSALPEAMQNTISKAIETGIASQRADTGGLTEAGSLLGVTSFTHEKAIEMFNTLQERVGHIREGGIKDSDVKRYTIDLMRRYGENELEKEHLLAKSAEFRSLSETGSVDKANEYFMKYMAKKFAGTDLATPEDFQGTKAAIDDKVDRAIAEKIGQGLTRDRYAVDVEDQIVLDLVAGYDLPAVPPVNLEGVNKDLRDAQPSMEFAALADYKPDTKGSLILQSYTAISEAAKPILERLDKDWTAINTLADEDIQTLQKMLIYANIPSSVTANEQEMNILQPLTMLMDRLQHHDMQDATEHDALRLENLYETFKQEVVLQESQYDKLTGLKNRGEYYLKMADALKNAESLPPGQTIRTIFIDLGFLQYFNTGGREVGNLAIQRTGELLETALERCGIDGDAFRYAGDEFTILFPGSEDDQNKLRQMLETVRDEIGEIPRTERSGDLYRPEKLMLNYGTADNAVAESAMEVLGEREAIPPDVLDTNNDAHYSYLANLQTRMADLGVESQKAQSRFRFMLNRMNADFPDAMPASEDMNILQRQTELLVKYSQKALLGEDINSLYALAHSPDYQLWDADDIPDAQGLARLEEYVAGKKSGEIAIAETIRQLEDLIVRGMVERSQNEVKISGLRQEVSTLQEIVRVNQAKAEQVEKALAEELKDERMIETLRGELATHQGNTSALEKKQQQLDQLEARQDELMQQIRQLEVQQKPVE